MNNTDLVELVDGGDAIGFGPTFDALRRAIPFDQALISTTLPRGGLQVVQPRQPDPGWVRSYSREHHLLDIVAWQALLLDRSLTLTQITQEGAGPTARIASRFRRAAMDEARYTRYMVTPLRQPLLEGYPGVLQLFRKAGEADFSSAEQQTAADAAAALDEASDRLRQRRRGDGQASHPLVHELPCRQLVVGPGGQVLFPREQAAMSPVLRSNVLGEADQKLEKFAGLFAPPPRRGKGRQDRDTAARDGDGDGALTAIPLTKGGTINAPDETGDRWIFRTVLYEFFPAVTGGRGGPVAIVSLPPECDAWSLLRQTDIEADVELSRLIPAITYMHENFSSGINLSEVAGSVGLSPFHFHRRFSELLGTTPKHFLYDCQIAHAKRQLASGELELQEIAKSSGFSHQSHFTSRFRQATGLTPKAWRVMVAELRGEGSAARAG